MRKKVAVVSLGDCRLEFYNTRKHIADEENERLVEKLKEFYDVFCPDTVFNIDEGLACADEIKKRTISAVIIHIPIWVTPNLALRIANSTPYPVILFGNT